jgi:hypothetical protein
MKKIILAVSLMLVSNLTMANSSDICAPSVLAKPTVMHCTQDNLSYSINISTLKSPSTCTDQDYVEVKTANISVYDLTQNIEIDAMTIPSELFSYTLSEKATFTSEDPELKLENCVTPLR